MTAYFALFYISFIVKTIAPKLENNMFKLDYHIYIYDFIQYLNALFFSIFNKNNYNTIDEISFLKILYWEMCTLGLIAEAKKITSL